METAPPQVPVFVIEGPHGHLKRAIADALLMRGSSDFEAVSGYRHFINEVVSRFNARNASRIDAERAAEASAAIGEGGADDLSQRSGLVGATGQLARAIA